MVLLDTRREYFNSKAVLSVVRCSLRGRCAQIKVNKVRAKLMAARTIRLMQPIPGEELNEACKSSRERRRAAASSQPRWVRKKSRKKNGLPHVRKKVSEAKTMAMLASHRE